METVLLLSPQEYKPQASFTKLILFMNVGYMNIIINMFFLTEYKITQDKSHTVPEIFLLLQFEAAQI